MSFNLVHTYGLHLTDQYQLLLVSKLIRHRPRKILVSLCTAIWTINIKKSILQKNGSVKWLQDHMTLRFCIGFFWDRYSTWFMQISKKQLTPCVTRITMVVSTFFVLIQNCKDCLFAIYGYRKRSTGGDHSRYFM